VPDAGRDRGEHGRLERQQSRHLVEEPAPVLVQADGAVRDPEPVRHLRRRDRRADQIVGAPAVWRRIHRDDRRGLGEVRPSDRGQGTVAERGLHPAVGPHQQTAREFGIQTVAQDRPLCTARAHEPFGRAMRQRESEMVAGTGQARVDDMPDAVPRNGVQDGRMPPDDLVVLGSAGRDQHQGRYAGKVDARVVVEIEPPHPVVRRAAAACRGRAAVPQCRESGRAEVPVRSGHQDHVSRSLPSWFSSVTTLDPDLPT
jgi:hypothetical protein